MKPRHHKTTLKDGWIARDAETGRFVAVGTENGVSRKTPKTEALLKEVSSRRNAALKRLVNR
ncbi:hypothetical protein [Allosediminivita pacifica]|uniref:Uncharacterized protein n=1 Tax=Allosediminivita pacifica TaxID=1267769 RepID=A0A2T6AWX3_9RHOB|nr:hypothetical protein [Allosediminivita pacifica]PTX48325.1 hypothetical protein C8N44_10915 [Allosediminivita pacifica]